MTYHRFNLPPSVEFRKAVVRRDQQCVLCGSTDNLRANRVDPMGPMTLENGRCLCMKCVKKHKEQRRLPRIRGRAQRQTLIAQINHLQRELAMVKGKEPPQEMVDTEPSRTLNDVDNIDAPGEDVPVEQAPPPEPPPEKPEVDLEIQRAEQQAEKERVKEERAEYWRLIAERKAQTP